VFWKRFTKNKVALVGLLFLSLEIAAGVCAPLLTGWDPVKLGLDKVLLNPGTEGHLLGTDEYGMDVWARLLYGARISLFIGFLVIGISLTIGVIMGSIAGYYGGWIDNVVMRLVDLLAAFPFFVLAISIMAVLGPGLFNVMIALGSVSWIGYARLTRAQFLSIKEKEFVESARAEGCSDLYIVARHILPNAIAPVIVQATLGMGGAILSASGLSFLGLGAQPPTPEWGAMLSAGQIYIRRSPHLSLYPGLAIMFTVLAFNFIGDGLRDSLDPRLR